MCVWLASGSVMFLTSGGGAAAFKLWLLCSCITTEYNDREEEERCKKITVLNCLWDASPVILSIKMAKVILKVSLLKI